MLTKHPFLKVSMIKHPSLYSKESYFQEQV